VSYPNTNAFRRVVQCERDDRVIDRLDRAYVDLDRQTSPDGAPEACSAAVARS
jgi:hypothetical protein